MAYFRYFPTALFVLSWQQQVIEGADNVLLLHVFTVYSHALLVTCQDILGNP